MSKIIVELILIGSRLLGKAFYKAVREELQASRETAKKVGGGRKGSQRASQDLKTGITVEEAQKILNITDIKNVDEVKKNYDYLFSVNDKSKGGSFYLQSKVFRAKERLDLEIENMSKEEKSKVARDG